MLFRSEMSTVWNPCANNIKSVLNGELTAEEAGKNMVTQIKSAIAEME